MNQPSEKLVRRGVVAVITRQDQLLVIRRSQFVAAPGTLCFPGGGIEPSESEPEALVRELNEELGVRVEPQGCLWRCVTNWDVQIAWWRAEMESSAVLTPNAAEVEAIYWLTPQQLLARKDLLESNRSFLQAAESDGLLAADFSFPGTEQA